jgi:hypothetical protein
MASNIVATDYDTTFPFLFFQFGVLANGIIVYRVRVFEETQLVLYRGMPVTSLKRWLQYALLYGLLLLPEFAVLTVLTPAHLRVADGWTFGLCAYSVLLLLNSVSFLEDFTMKGYLRVVLVILCAVYFFVISDSLHALFMLFFVMSAGIFFTSYYLFEKNRGQIGQ